MNKTETATLQFLTEASKTVVFGQVTVEGFFTDARFTVDGVEYYISSDECRLKRINRTENGDEYADVSLCADKNGLRSRYQVTLFGVRVNLTDTRIIIAMLRPGALPQILADNSVEVNHMATCYSKDRLEKFNSVVDYYKSFKDGGKPFDKRLAEALSSVSMQDMIKVASELTGCFTHMPIYPRINDVRNLELCSHADNVAHNAVIQSFVVTRELPGIEYKPVAANVAALFHKGAISRDEFINYVDSLPDIRDVCKK